MKLFQKYSTTIFLFLFLASFAKAQVSDKEIIPNYFKENSYKRIHLGRFSTYFGKKIALFTGGFDYGVKLIKIKPDFKLIDLSLGSNFILAFDGMYNSSRARPNYTRIVPGIELNWNLRLYFLRIQSINTQLYLEGLGMTFVYYAIPYPDKGTKINIGSHVGIGMDYQINSKLRGFKSLRLFHTSNGKDFDQNPTINAIGVVMGIQF